jgi:hypothetical protein
MRIQCTGCKVKTDPTKPRYEAVKKGWHVFCAGCSRNTYHIPITEAVEEHATQGCTTTEKPFELSSGLREHHVTYRGEAQVFATTNMGDAESMVNSLNEAYRRGWHNASIELMNKETP